MTARKAEQYDLISFYYDLFKSDLKHDLPFYLNAARETGGPILELACGTGRVSLSLAREGFEVTGVDISSGMLRRAEEKLDKEQEVVRKRVTLVHADIADWLPDAKFGLIFIALNSWFQVETREKRLDILRGCKERLKGSGAFALDTYVWDGDEARPWGDIRPDGRLFYDGTWLDPAPESQGGIIQRFRSDKIDPATLHLVRIVFCDHVSPSGQVRRVMLRDDEYYVPPENLQLELKEAGFGKIDAFGGYNGERLYDASLTGRGRQLYIARV